MSLWTNIVVVEFAALKADLGRLGPGAVYRRATARHAGAAGRLTALLVQADGVQGGGSAGGMFSAKLSDNDLAWATRQLASLLGASLPLEAALSATVEQAERKH